MKQEEESLEFEFPSDNNLLASCVDMSSIAFLGMNLGRVGIQLMSSLTFSFSLFNSVELTVSSTTYRTKKTTNRAHPITIKNITWRGSARLTFAAFFIFVLGGAVLSDADC